MKKLVIFDLDGTLLNTIDDITNSINRALDSVKLARVTVDEAKYMYVVTGRDKEIHYNNYLIDWTDFDAAQFNHWTKSEKEIKKPENWLKAVQIAENLAAPLPFVRVDLYIIKDMIYISEMTFTPAKGTLTFKDDKSDFIIGEWLSIQK